MVKTFAAIILISSTPAILLAQGAKPISQAPVDEAVSAFAIQDPDEGSPFFQDREAAQAAVNRQTAQQATDRVDRTGVAIYPKAKDSADSATTIFTKFFTDMFSSVKFGSIRTEKTTEKLSIDPPEFSLLDRREVEVTYSVRNNTKRVMRFDYPSRQRVEILTSNPQGEVIDRWSDDRSFEQKEGFVFINPRERIEYQEKIPTRDMKAGQTYTIQAEVVGKPEYTTTKTVTPTD